MLLSSIFGIAAATTTLPLTTAGLSSVESTTDQTTYNTESTITGVGLLGSTSSESQFEWQVVQFF